MKTLKIHHHPDVTNLNSKSVFTRFATRAITIINDKVLLLHTKRYDDYSLPGGGLNKGEDKVQGMIRELQEETGAKNIKEIKPFGIYEEYRPWHKPDFDVQHMVSYCYTCTVDKELSTTKYEDYEINNGMKAMWVDLKTAIKHNEKTILESDKKGMSVERETFLLKLILKIL